MFKSEITKKNKDDHIEKNVNNVVNLASQKLKELISKKQDLVSQNSYLKGQKNVLNSDIHHYTKEAKEKEELIEKMIEEFNAIGEELIELEKEYAVTLQEYKMKEEEMKNNTLYVSSEICKVNDNNKMENSIKKHEVQIEYENLIKAKQENKDLLEQYYNFKRELYIAETEYKDMVQKEELRNLKAKKGIDIINKMYYFEYKEENENIK